MKKVAILKVGDKVVKTLEIKELTVEEFLALQKEAEKNLQDLKDQQDLLLKCVALLQQEIDNLKNEIKYIKGVD